MGPRGAKRLDKKVEAETGSHDIIVVELLSLVQFFETPWAAAHQASLSLTISQSLLKLMSIG